MCPSATAGTANTTSRFAAPRPLKAPSSYRPRHPTPPRTLPPAKPPQPCPHHKNVGAALVAALRVRLFICGRTNAAHRPRAPVPTRTPLRVKIQRGSPAPASCCLTATNRLVPQQQARSRAAKSWPPPVPQGYRMSRTKARVHAYGHSGLARILYRTDARCLRLKMRMFLSRRTNLPQTPTTSKKQKTGAALPWSPQHYLARLFLSQSPPSSPPAHSARLA